MKRTTKWVKGRHFLAVFSILLAVIVYGVAATMQVSDSVSYAVSRLGSGNGGVKKVLFSPEDDIEKVIGGLIVAEKKSIQLATYVFTNKDIASALVAAHKSGIVVEVIVDGEMVGAPHSKIASLQEGGVPVYAYYPHKKAQSYQAKMHNKFIIFHETILGKKIAVNGSCNCTSAAFKKNRENMLFFDERDLIADYARCFKKLKAECVLLGHSKPTAQKPPSPSGQKPLAPSLFSIFRHARRQLSALWRSLRHA